MRQILKQAREAYNNGEGLTQKETATTIGISEIHYRNIENGTREGKGRIWDALEALFGIPQRLLRKNDSHLDSTIPPLSGEDISANLAEGRQAVEALNKAAKIVSCSEKVADLMMDYGQNGQVNGDEFRPIFEELREVVNGAFV